jgi:hypothetical protein
MDYKQQRDERFSRRPIMTLVVKTTRFHLRNISYLGAGASCRAVGLSQLIPELQGYAVQLDGDLDSCDVY